MTPSEKTERRFVRSADPSLSDEANAMLTAELRTIVGKEEVEVPAARPRTEAGRHGGRRPAVADIWSGRIAFVLAAAAGVVVLAAVLAFTTGSAWGLAIALVVLLLALGTVVRTISAFSGEMNHPSPELAARLEDEGVADPDRLFDALVQEFTPPGRKAERDTPPPDAY